MRYRINSPLLYKDVAHAAVDLNSSIARIATELQIDHSTLSKMRRTQGTGTSAAILLCLCQHLGLDPFKYLVDTDPD